MKPEPRETNRFNPNVEITEDMIWHPQRELMRRSSRDQNFPKEPTWASLFWQVVLGFVDVLMPLAFMLGMMYWRAPWLFRAMIHLFKGEPLFRF